MQKTIPPHLMGTYKMLECAFPNGIDERVYLPLLSVLHEQMSDRTLARVIADYTGRDLYIVLNDVYRVGATEKVSSESTDKIKQQLADCDYEKWLAGG